MAKVIAKGVYVDFMPDYSQVAFSPVSVTFSKSTQSDNVSDSYFLQYSGNFIEENGIFSGEITGIIYQYDGLWGASERGKVTFSEGIHIDDLAALQRSGTIGTQLLMSGSDDLYGLYSGYNGNDTFHTHFNQKIDGGAGFDTVVWDQFNPSVKFDISQDGSRYKSVEAFVGTGGSDVMTGDRQANNFDGAGGNDRLFGGYGSDKLFGGASNDKLAGESGDDRLSGGSGNDWLSGGAGKDLLDGGIGRDVFAFKTYKESAGPGADHIKSFNTLQDMIDLRSIDARIENTKDQAFEWIGKDSFDGESGQLRYFYSGTRTLIAGDVDGDRQADFQLYIDQKVALTASDFQL